eukprot:2166920-Rhodomonas_salina.1
MRSDPVRAEVVRWWTCQSDPNQHNPHQPDPIRSDPIRPDPIRSDSVPVWPEVLTLVFKPSQVQVLQTLAGRDPLAPFTPLPLPSRNLNSLSETRNPKLASRASSCPSWKPHLTRRVARVCSGRGSDAAAASPRGAGALRDG